MILADDIVAMAGGPLDVGGFASNVSRFLKDAQKFVYEPNTASALARLAKSKPDTLLAALPLCRAPFPVVWLEWPGGLGDGEPRPDQIIPLKFGVLIRSLNEEGTKLGLLFAYGSGAKRTCLVPAAAEIDLLAPTAGCLSPLEAMAKKTTVGLSEMARDFMKIVRIRGGKTLEDAMIKSSMEDIQGELQYVIAALCLLSAKAGVNKEPADLAKINKRRKINGKRELLSYSTVKIAISLREERAANAAGMTAAEMRQHIVRGHFKVRPSGVYWWRPFVRGKASAGTVVRQGYSVSR